jgi:undecaprenyl-diphosphatase
MFSVLIRADQELFLLLNGLHAPWVDAIMSFVSGKLSWLPLYIFLVVVLARHYKWRTLLVLLAVVLCITLADQTSSAFLKPTVGRLRPCHDPLLAPDVHVVQGCGGMYGFVSSHAANTFGLALLLWLLLGRHHHWFRYLFVWAGLVGYSRIYLGVHYPLDILGGFGVGALSALISFAAFRYANHRLMLYQLKKMS